MNGFDSHIAPQLEKIPEVSLRVFLYFFKEWIAWVIESRYLP